MPLPLLPRCPCSAHPRDDKKSSATPPGAVKVPCHFKICPVSRPLLKIYIIYYILKQSASLFLSSFCLPSLCNSCCSTQPDLCNAISLLAIYGRGCHGNYGLHLPALAAAFHSVASPRCAFLSRFFLYSQHKCSDNRICINALNWIIICGFLSSSTPHRCVYVKFCRSGRQRNKAELGCDSLMTASDNTGTETS